jgi:hypothetical protein
MRITSQDDTVEPVKVQLANPANSMTSMRRLAVTLKANIDDVKMPLLLFTNFAYGVMSAYFPLIVTQTVADTLGSSNVGILYAISGMASCILAMGFGGVAEWCGQHGRAIIMVVGAASFGIVCFVFTVCAASFYSQWKVLIPLFILYGSGQAVWQGTVSLALPTSTNPQFNGSRPHDPSTQHADNTTSPQFDDPTHGPTTPTAINSPSAWPSSPTTGRPRPPRTPTSSSIAALRVR